MQCNFSKRKECDTEEKLRKDVILYISKFKNLGQTIKNDRNTNEDAPQMQKDIGAIYVRKVPTKFKGQFYPTAIHSAVLYCSE